MSAALATTPPERSASARFTAIGILREALTLMRGSLYGAWSIWAVATVFFTGTDLVDIIYGGGANPLHSPLTMISLAIRVIANIWVAAAAIRAFANRGAIWAIDLALLRYTAAFLLLIVGSIGLLLALSRLVVHPLIAMATSDTHISHIVSMAVTGAWLVGFTLLTVRWMPWIVALAIGDRVTRFSIAWQGMRGAMLAAIGAYLLVAPVMIAHFLLTIWAQSLAGSAQFWVTTLDGVVSVVQVMSGMAVAVVLYRHVADEKTF